MLEITTLRKNSENVGSTCKITSTDPYFSALFLDKWAMNCCGLAILRNFYSTKGFSSDPKEFLSFLWTNQRAGMGEGAGWAPYNFLYLLTTPQLDTPLHTIFVECGSKELDVFDNEAHSSDKLHLFRFNIKGAIGKYIDQFGKPLAEPKVTEPPGLSALSPWLDSKPTAIQPLQPQPVFISPQEKKEVTIKHDVAWQAYEKELLR